MSKKAIENLTLIEALKKQKKKQLEELMTQPLSDVFKRSFVPGRKPFPEHKLVMLTEATLKNLKFSETQTKTIEKIVRVQVKIYCEKCRICAFPEEVQDKIAEIYTGGVNDSEMLEKGYRDIYDKIVDELNLALIRPNDLRRHIGAGHLNSNWKEKDKGWVFYYLYADDDSGTTRNVFVHYSDEVKEFFEPKEVEIIKENEATEKPDG